MKNQTLIVIGGGAMGGAMAIRWHARGLVVHVVEANEGRRHALSARGLTCHATLGEAPQGDIYVLAIKPQQFADMAASLGTTIRGHGALLVSIMAGITLAQLHKISNHALRVMPNLPATIGESMSVLCAPTLDASSRKSGEELLRAVGKVAWVEREEQLHAVTAISGSGPAYMFALMEAMQHAAIAQGLDATLARQLVTQTMRGAALLADASAEDAATLRTQVTSKGGTTEAALQQLTEAGFLSMMARAIEAASARSAALANPGK